MRVRSEAPKRKNQFRPDECNLPPQIRFALRHFIGLRVAVARRTAFDDICNVDILAARQSNGAQHIVQQASRLTNKGSPRRSSFAPGASPTSIQSAFESPTPNTVWVRCSQSPQRVQYAHSAANAPQSSCSIGTEVFSTTDDSACEASTPRFTQICVKPISSSMNGSGRGILNLGRYQAHAVHRTDH